MAHFKRNDQQASALDTTSVAARLDSARLVDEIDAKMGFERYETGPPRVGWLVNFQPTIIFDPDSEDSPNGKSAVDFYFLDEEGGYFKSTIQYDPYFYVHCSGRESEVEEYLRKRFEGVVKNTRRITKEDLSLPNHLLGNKISLIELQFWNEQDMFAVRRALQPLIGTNKKRNEMYGDSFDDRHDPEAMIIDFREHDVPYHVRLTIDLKIRVGKWYRVTAPAPHSPSNQTMTLEEMPERIVRADPVVMAFDIETTKLPLKFPDARIDAVMMISYMIDGRGYLITNRELVSKDIGDFEYTPKPEFKGEFTIFNEPCERDVLARFFEHIRDEKPTVIATYNGDSFDWPFVAARAAVHGLDMYAEIGFKVDNEGEYKSSYCVHMDCFRWVKRDSYLPQGSQGLKAVTTAKLGYNPLEIDPELMTPYAAEKPQVLSEYSVSDAVATYYLYMKYVHPFIFSLCNILPLRPDEVLRKGTGTLCEMLLMVQAYEKDIVLPHKHTDPPERYYDGHLVESETYVGGHVESLEAGVFRSDIPTNFKVDNGAIDELLDQLDAALKFTIQVENQTSLDQVVNYDSVKKEIENMLIALKQNPKRIEEPLIYHVDVASMYPNIMTSNRLQPDSMKSERDCAMCDFNVPDKTCDRRLPWSWRGEFFPPKRDEVLMLQQQLKSEMFTKPTGSRNSGDTFRRTWDQLSRNEQVAHIRQRVSDYSRKVYHKLRDSETVEREAIICQRENPFYVNTVRDFRDRRYEFKGKQKVWKQNLSKAQSATDKEEAAKMVVLFDSLQLAHKVILNSFYGYVMRKGSRWYSMEMAGVTCLTGATIIQLARGMVERLGRPLELDTDGIWCILPKSFPGDMNFELANGKKIPFAYPCVMLNHLVHEKFTNHQYQTLVDTENLVWETSSDNTIFFEVDGPYKAMMLPSSREEGKGLKKRYAVFNFDGSLAELKGFEMKRRGELQLIKTFQTQLFSQFLKGKSLEDCYAAVAAVANSWLDVLDSKGATLEDVDLMNMISENKSMSKSLEEYGGQKSTSICTARRLAEFLGKEMVKDKGLACQYIISAEPSHEPVTNRAIPIQIFNAPPAKKQEFLRKWLKKPQLDDFDPRAIIDWAYYRERLGATIQKLIVIPAARQQISNPVPRVPPPAWLARRIANESDNLKQQTISFAKINREELNPWGSSETLVDIEDSVGSGPLPSNGKKKAVVKRKVTEVEVQDEEVSAEHAPNPDVDYRAWVVYMKRVWQQRKAQHEARRQLFGPQISGKRLRGIQGLLRQQTESAWAAGGGIWTIVGLKVTSDPGKVQASVYVNGRLQTVSILVHRTIFVKMRADNKLPPLPQAISAEPSDWLLPSGASCSSLYRLTMSEQQYQDERARTNGLLKNRGVEAVYEQHISALDRVILKLGSHCRLVSNGSLGLLGRGLDTGFELDWLEPIPNDIVQDIGLALDYAFYQHIEVHGRQIAIIITSWGEDVSVLEYIPKGAIGAGDWAANLRTEYTSQRSRQNLDQPLFKLPEKIEVTKSESFVDIRRFWSATAKTLSEAIGQKPKSAVTVVQSSRGFSWMASRLRMLHDLPVINMASPLGSILPSIGWQAPLAKQVVKTFLFAQYQMSSMRKLASYVDLPLSNLPMSDDVRHVVDIVYARRLIASKHVLWWGEARANTSLTAIDLENAAKDVKTRTTDEPGLYPHVCLDMSLSNLVVNTILTSPYLMDTEAIEQAEPTLLVDAFSPAAWRGLVALTREWWQKASSGDKAADLCVQQVAGWIASPSSQLWDPKLAHKIHTLSQKALSQLTVELRKFGTSVVYCERDGQRLLVATTKKSAAMAVAFGGLVVREIKTKELFTYLDISVDETWDFMVWMNNSNYCGRFLGSSGPEYSVGELVYSSTWQIADYLPPLLQDEFHECVLSFLEIITAKKDSALSAAGGASTKPISADFMQHEVLERFGKSFTNRVRQLQGRYTDAVSRNTKNSEFETPNLPGSRPDMAPENPVLSFAKTVLAVVSLISDADDFTKLKRKVLGLLNIGDFDPSAQFHDPAAKLIVPEVVCGTCMACSDVDVCSGRTRDFRSVCPSCQSEFNRVHLEERLIQMLVTKVASFQLQDLTCTKCGKVRPNDLAVHCPCSGVFKETTTADKVYKDLAVFRHVGEYYDLRLLNDLISQY